MNKIKYLGSSLTLLMLVTRAFSDCQYWDGAAPFCKGSCPGECETIASSKRGNGALCWTGSKKLCDCYPSYSADELCIPNHTERFCFPISSFFGVPIGVGICRDMEFTKTCSIYRCGLCVGFGVVGVKRNIDNNGTCNITDVTYIDPRPTDIMVQGNITLSEDEIEDMLVSRFGPKLTCEQMRNVKVIEFNYTEAL